MIEKTYTQEEMDKATQKAYDKGRDDGFASGVEQMEYEGY